VQSTCEIFWKDGKAAPWELVTLSLQDHKFRISTTLPSRIFIQPIWKLLWTLIGTISLFASRKKKVVRLRGEKGREMLSRIPKGTTAA